MYHLSEIQVYPVVVVFFGSARHLVAILAQYLPLLPNVSKGHVAFKVG